MGSYHLWDYDWTPLSQNPCWNHTTILSLRDVLRISCKNTLVGRLRESKLYGIEWNGSTVAIVCRRLNVKEGLYEYELACSSESLRFSLSFWLNRKFGKSEFFGIFRIFRQLAQGRDLTEKTEPAEEGDPLPRHPPSWPLLTPPDHHHQHWLAARERRWGAPKGVGKMLSWACSRELGRGQGKGQGGTRAAPLSLPWNKGMGEQVIRWV